ncbi:hypothetical protein ACP3WF_23885, partial [Salmonella enterica]|uniref:hypothetical protein n=1 Tax=Salmonella enterica TaxID=28901 RepID=UPI003CE8F81E
DRLVGITKENSVLRGEALNLIETINNAYVDIENGVIVEFGPFSATADQGDRGYEYIDAKGATVLPCWCDSHTHIVFAASREHEFVDK